MKEPEIISDAKSGLAYLLVLGFITGGILVLLAGMVAFLFTPWAGNRAKILATEEQWGTYDLRLKVYRKVMGLVLILWFVLSWTAIYFMYRNGI